MQLMQLRHTLVFQRFEQPEQCLRTFFHVVKHRGNFMQNCALFDLRNQCVTDLVKFSMRNIEYTKFIVVGEHLS